MHKKIANLAARLPLFWKVFLGAFASAIILVLLAWSLWQQFFADTVIAWVPDDAVFYAHLSLPRYSDNAAYGRLADALLAQTATASSTDNIIKRELAFAVLPAGSAYNSLAFLRADSPSKLEQSLKSNGISYRRLDREHFAIGEKQTIDSLIKNSKNRLAAKVGKRFSHWSTLYLYGEKQFIAAWLNDNAADYWQYVLLAFAGGDEINLNLFSNQEKNWGWLGDFQHRKKIKPVPSADADLMFKLADQSELAVALASASLPAAATQNLNEATYGYGLNLADPAIQKMAKSGISGLVKRKNSTGTGWFWSDHDILLKISDSIGNIQTTTLEGIFKRILARQTPRDKKVQLKDGTFITERILDPETIKFRRSGDLMASNPDLPIRIYYQTSSAGLILSNNLDHIVSTGTPEIGNNFISLKTSLLNGRGIWIFLKYFDRLDIYGNGQVEIK